jgi:Gnt-I system high-affinity gluconate transporter
MILTVIVISLFLLIVLITQVKINAFLSFLIVSVLAGIWLGIPLHDLLYAIEKGIGSVMGSLMLILVLGAMLGKLVAESGAAEKIAAIMVRLMGEKHIQWGLMLTGFIVGIPLFYGVGFVLLVPLIFSISYRYKLPSVYIGLPMLAALSVTHGFIPPHPSPVALVALFKADMGMTLIYGLLIAIPAIVLGGPVFGMTLKNIQPKQGQFFKPVGAEVGSRYKMPSARISFFASLFPVFLLIIGAVTPYFIGSSHDKFLFWVKFVSNPTIVMLLAILFAGYSLGIKQGRSIKSIMKVFDGAVRDIAMILFIIAGSGVFKQVMEDSGVSFALAAYLQTLPVHPLVLAWLITAVIRGCIGSATVAALTAAGVLLPLATGGQVHPSLMVLAIGAGSLMFSHVNDAGFWLFKEYFGLSVKDTLLSWSIMEAIVSIVGLLAVLGLDVVIN